MSISTISRRCSEVYSSSREQTPYGLLLRGELESFHRSSDAYLYHEHLEDFNAPIYFHEFAERAARHGLKYLGEADLRVMVPGNYPPEIENVLQMLAQDNIQIRARRADSRFVAAPLQFDK